jgi:hypothetical protein
VPIDPVPVIVTDTATELPEITSTIAGILALVLALLSIRISQRQGRKAEKSIATERRMVFELTVLRDLLNLVATESYDAVRKPAARALVESLPDSALPLFRKGVSAGPYADIRAVLTAELDKRPRRLYPEPIPRDRIDGALMGEIRRAMGTRVKTPLTVL